MVSLPDEDELAPVKMALVRHLPDRNDSVVPAGLYRVGAGVQGLKGLSDLPTRRGSKVLFGVDWRLSAGGGGGEG